MKALEPTPSSPDPAVRERDRRHRVRPAPAVRARHAVRALAAVGLASLSLAVGGPRAQAAEASPVRMTLGERLTEQEQADRWRARGLAFVDLPFGLRARYDAQALLRLSPRSAIPSRLFDLPTETTQRTTRMLESRFALSRAVAPRIELELSWAARSPLTVVDLLRVEDQRVTAMIRLVP